MTRDKSVCIPEEGCVIERIELVFERVLVGGVINSERTFQSVTVSRLRVES